MVSSVVGLSAVSWVRSVDFVQLVVCRSCRIAVWVLQFCLFVYIFDFLLRWINQFYANYLDTYDTSDLRWAWSHYTVFFITSFMIMTWWHLRIFILRLMILLWDILPSHYCIIDSCIPLHYICMKHFCVSPPQNSVYTVYLPTEELSLV